MIDLHAHILPGMDDGPSTEAEALEMARMAVRDGIAVLVATPHCLDGRHANFCHEIRLACVGFNALLKKERIALQVLPGSEIRFCPELIREMTAGRLMTLGDTGRYFLMELPDSFVDSMVIEVVFQMVGQGRIPIVCHPERNRSIQQAPSRLKPILAAGALSQITGGSLTGKFGPRAKTTAMQLLKAGMVHLLGSDAHSPTSRPPVLSRAQSVVSALAGSHVLKIICDYTPRRVIGGQAIPSAQRVSPAFMETPWRPEGILDRMRLCLGRKGRIF